MGARVNHCIKWTAIVLLPVAVAILIAYCVFCPRPVKPEIVSGWWGYRDEKDSEPSSAIIEQFERLALRTDPERAVRLLGALPQWALEAMQRARFRRTLCLAAERSSDCGTFLTNRPRSFASGNRAKCKNESRITTIKCSSTASRRSLIR